MHLRTDRLVVRDLAMADLDDVHRMLDVDLGVGDRSRAERAEWLQWTVLDYAQRRRSHQPPYGDYAIGLPASQALVGVVGLVPCLEPFGLLPSHSDQSSAYAFAVPEVGLFWAVAATHQGRGYATEAATALVEFGFRDLRLRRIVATTATDNTASIAVMRRLGMRVERNPFASPAHLQVVGVVENPAGPPVWIDRE